MDPLQALVSQEGITRDQLANGVWLRKATVSARNATTRTCTISIGGNDIAGVQIGNAAAYVPMIGDQRLWVFQRGTGLLVMGAGDAKVPAVRIQKTGDAAISHATNTPIAFAEAGVKYDPHDMYDEGISTTRITIKWPGVYAFGTAGYWANQTPTHIGRRICEVLKNGSVALATARLPAGIGSTAAIGDNHLTCSSEAYLVAGDYLEMQVFQSSGGPLSVQLQGEFSPVLWASWRGPGN